jgi:phosphatidylinositol glycan class M
MHQVYMLLCTYAYHLKYFLWYMMFLPYYLPESSLLRSRTIGLFALAAWIVGQAAWLQQGFQLEFNGHSTFVPGLWLSSILFFVVNVGILGIIVDDTKTKNHSVSVAKKRL